MSISYKLYKNHLTNGAGQYRAGVEFVDTIDLEGVIDLMLFRGSSITKADILAVLQDYHDTIYRSVLQGYKVITPGAQYGVTLKGNFTNKGDSFDPSRHRIEPLVTPSLPFRRAVQNQVEVVKQEANTPQPYPEQYLNLSNGQVNNQLVRGGLGQILGRRLRFDPADPNQGIFLVATDESARRMPPEGKNMPGELIFQIPTDLIPGEYILEVRALFNNGTLRVGRLDDLLTVPN